MISDLYFIQRFRASKAVDGEAAYSLTNLEAAISFLETVDLATLKMEEGEPGTSLPGTKPSPLNDSRETAVDRSGHLHLLPCSSNPSHVHPTAIKRIATNASASSSASSLLPPQTPGRPRKLSYLTPIDIAANAVSSADQGLRSIGSSLEGSYKFLFGKLDRQGQDAPKTLEDARRLMESPTLLPEAGFLSAIDGVLKRRTSDSSLRSSTSAEKSQTHAQTQSQPIPLAGPVQKAATMPVVDQVGESVKNFGNQLGRFAGMGVMRGFSRSGANTTSATQVAATGTSIGSRKEHGLGIVVKDENGKKTHVRTESGTVVDLLSVSGTKAIGRGDNTDSAQTFPELATELSEKRDKIWVNRRFLNMQGSGELRLSEIPELLDAYKMLAVQLKQRGLITDE